MIAPAATIPPEAWDQTHPDHIEWVKRTGRCFGTNCARHRLVAVDHCECPLLDEPHRYGKGCVTACPDCGAPDRCQHDDPEPAA